MSEQLTNFFTHEVVTPDAPVDTQPTPVSTEPAPAATVAEPAAPAVAPADPAQEPVIQPAAPANIPASPDSALEALRRENEMLNRFVSQTFQQPQHPHGLVPPPVQVQPTQLQALQHIADEDYLSGRDFKTVASQMMADIRSQAMTELQAANAAQSERMAAMRYPDFNEVVSKYLPGVLRSQKMVDAIRADSDPAELAYALAKTNPEYMKDVQAKQAQQVAQKIQQNLGSQGSIAAAPAAVTQKVTPQDEAERIRNMSDAEFDQLLLQRRGYI